MKPTYAQINLLYRWFSWNIPRPLAKDAMDWLEENATRSEVSQEIRRVRVLYYKHALTEEECFNSPIWDGFRKEG